MAISTKVFILTSHWEDVKGKLVLTYYGRSPKLGPVKIIFDDKRSVFLLPSDSTEEQLSEISSYQRRPSQLKSLNGEELDILRFRNHKNARDAANNLHYKGVSLFEADIKPDERLLQEKFIHGQCAIKGKAEYENGLLCFRNPAMTSCEVETDLRVSSVDIETGVESDRLYSIAAHNKGAGPEKKICFMLGDERRDIPEENLHIYPKEDEVLRAFIDWFNDDDPDVIIGWYVIGFDLDYLIKKCEQFYMDFTIGRDNGICTATKHASGNWFADIPGRIVIDGIPAFRDAGFRFENYKLETVSQAILKEGKTIKATQEEKIAEIERQFAHDKIELARYNIQDCVLVTRLYERVNMVNFTISRVKTSGLLAGSLGIPSAASDKIILPRLHKKGFAAPSSREWQTSNFIFPHKAAELKKYASVLEIRFEEVLWSLMTTFNIDPLSTALPADDNSKNCPGDHQTSAANAILPGYLNNLLSYYHKSKEMGLKASERASHSTLALLERGLFAQSGRIQTPLFTKMISDALSWFLQLCQSEISIRDQKLIYADRERMFIAMNDSELTAEAADDFITKLEAGLNAVIDHDFNTQGNIRLKAANYYKKFSFSLAKDTSLQFAGLKRNDSNDFDIVLEGLELTGNSWCEMARIFQEKLYRAYLSEEDLTTWIKRFVADLKNGAYKQDLAFERRLTKRAAEYTGTVPPHVRAAEYLDKPGKFITFCHTLTKGPYPWELNPSDFDYDFYIDSQLAPVANPLLALQGKKLQELFQAEQLNLFEGF